MHCIVEGEVSTVHIPNTGCRTAGTLSFPSFAPGGTAQSITKAPAETADKCFLSPGQDRHTIVWELRWDSSRSVERKVQLLAALAVVLGTRLQT